MGAAASGAHEIRRQRGRRRKRRRRKRRRRRKVHSKLTL